MCLFCAACVPKIPRFSIEYIYYVWVVCVAECVCVYESDMWSSRIDAITLHCFFSLPLRILLWIVKRAAKHVPPWHSPKITSYKFDSMDNSSKTLDSYEDMNSTAPPPVFRSNCVHVRILRSQSANDRTQNNVDENPHMKMFTIEITWWTVYARPVWYDMDESARNQRWKRWRGSRRRWQWRWWRWRRQRIKRV